MDPLSIVIGLAVGVVGTLIVMNNKTAIAKKALAAEQAAKAALQAELDKLKTAAVATAQKI